MEIGKRLAEKRINSMRNTADLRKDIRFILGWHLRYIVGRQASYLWNSSAVYDISMSISESQPIDYEWSTVGMYTYAPISCG